MTARNPLGTDFETVAGWLELNNDRDNFNAWLDVQGEVIEVEEREEQPAINAIVARLDAATDSPISYQHRPVLDASDRFRTPRYHGDTRSPAQRSEAWRWTCAQAERHRRQHDNEQRKAAHLDDAAYSRQMWRALSDYPSLNDPRRFVRWLWTQQEQRP